MSQLYIVFKSKIETLLFLTLLLCTFTLVLCGGTRLSSNQHGSDRFQHDFQRTVSFDLDSDHDDQSFTRRKREAVADIPAGNSSKIITSVNKLNDSHNQLVVYWAGQDVIVCLAKNITENSTSSLYISRDYGSSFTDISEKFVITEENGKKILPMLDKFYNHPKNNGHFVFTDVTHKYIFSTSDYGISFTSTQLEFSPEEVSFDPKAEHTIVAYEKNTPELELWVSSDAGISWVRVQTHVKSITWNESSFPTKLLITREEPTQTISVLSSSTVFMDTKNTSVVVARVEEFEMREDFMFATKTIGPNALVLLVSYKEGRFVPAVFPSNLPIQHFHIADVSDGQIFVCAVHNESYANLYVGNQPEHDRDPIQFSLSLERIIFFKPNVTWTNSWLNDVTDQPFVELHRVDGLRGVYIASQLKSSTVSASKFSLEHIVSVITFDQGGEWKPLHTPDVDNDGEPIYCKLIAAAATSTSKNCSLHISQRLSQLHPSTRAPPILSQKSAVGLVMATGTIDNSLKGHLGVFLSNDGAVHWRQVLQGNYLYNFGDHGGVIVAVQYYKRGLGTNSLVYSTDEGTTWNSHEFYPDKIRVLGLMTEPGENTTVFFIFGSETTKHSWVLIKVDLKNIFDKQCGKDDYREWSPLDSNPGRHCLLGRSDYYQRRLPNSNCYNGLEYERPIRTKLCLCTRTDFECDFGYKEDPTSRDLKCIKDTSNTSQGIKAEWCKPGESYYSRTKGYRKIPGDMCIGEEATPFMPATIPCAVDQKLEFMLVAKRDSVLRIDMNDFSHVEVLPLGRLNSTVAIDFNLKNNCIFWSDVNDDKIMKLHLDGKSEPEVLVSRGVKSVEGLAFDWIAQTLYFADGGRKTIEVIRTDVHGLGRMRKKVLDSDILDKPRGIAVHPVKGLLFWTDWSTANPGIGSSNLDGSNAKLIVKNEGTNLNPSLKWPNGIAVDVVKDKIYWVDANTDKMLGSDLDGQNVKVVLEKEIRILHPFGVAVFKNQVYWDDWITNGIYAARIDSGNPRDNIITVKSNLTRSMDLKVFGHTSQVGTNPCSDSTKCEFLCLAKSDNTFSCPCPDALTRGANGSCFCPDGKPVVNGHCESKCNETGTFQCRSGFCISNTWRCDGDNDCADNSDEEECDQVPKCAANQFQCTTDKKCIPLHWKCDTDVDCIDGSDEFECPYPSFCNSTEHFQCDNKICLLKKWVCDGMDDCGDYSDEKNCNHTQEACAAGEFLCENKQCISNQWVCDGDSDCGDASDEKSCGNISCPDYKFRCTNTSQCILNSWKCDGDQDCSDNSDELNCTSIPVPPPTTNPFGAGNCSNMEQMFQCHDSAHCIPIFWKCDSVDDCNDGSDELGCEGNTDSHSESSVTIAPFPECPTDHYQCATGECIYEDQVCDTFPDCPSASDELHCDSTFLKCPDGYVQCPKSMICIPKENWCDGLVQCPNKMDEVMCSTTNKTSVNDGDCNDGQFSCDNGDCHPLYQLCDSTANCYDASDEDSSRCTAGFKRIHQVAGISIDEENDVSGDHVFMEWWVDGSLKGPMEFLPSWCTVSTNECSNSSKWITDRKYTIQSGGNTTILKPFTSYNATVYVRADDGTISSPAVYKRFISGESGSSPPRNVTVDQPDIKTLCVSWDKPLYPNGKITKYFVHVSPPIPPLNIESKNRNYCFTNRPNNPYFLPRTNYTFWVTAKNGYNTSAESKSVVFLFDKSIVQITTVSVKEITNSSAILGWTISGENVDEYQINYEFAFASNLLLMFPQQKSTKENSLKITGLSPGMKYKFSVSPVYKGVLGTPAKYSFSTKGSQLPKVREVSVEAQKNQWHVSWLPPTDNRTSGWVYGVYYGKSVQEIATKELSVKTNGTFVNLKDLEGCGLYFVMVGVVGPYGIGPLSNPKQIQTPLDERSPPKNLKVREGDDHMSLVMSWNSPCPTSEKEFGYDITFRETQTNYTKVYRNAVSTSKQLVEYTIKLDYGGTYEAYVSTNVTGGRPSSNIKFDGIPIPPPIELHECTACDAATVFWESPLNLPKVIREKKIEYIVHLSETEAFRNPKQFNTTELSYRFPEIQNGHVYYVAVSLRDSDGLQSPLSAHIALQHLAGTDKISMSTGNALGIVITVILVIGLLVAALAVFVVRHRRLQASFLNFASTHYSTSSGAATFQQGMEDDQDSPIIRGFSDDEPLLVA